MTKHTKWKMTRGETFVRKVSKPQTFRKFNRVEKGALLGIVLMLGFFLPTFAYYQTNIANSHSSAADPYTTLWNGQFNPTGFGKLAVQEIEVYGTCPANTYCSQFINTNFGDMIIVLFFEQASGACQSASETVTDSQSNTYTAISPCQSGGYHGSYSEWSAIGSAPANLNVTIRNTVNDMEFGVLDLFAAKSFAVISTTTGITSLAGSDPQSISANKGEILFDLFKMSPVGGAGCVSISFMATGAASSNIDGFCASYGAESDVAFQENYAQVDYQRDSTVVLTDSWGLPYAPMQFLHVILAVPSNSYCPASYQCNALAASSNFNQGTIVLSPNSTYYADALTTSKISIANGASKALAFSIDWLQRDAFDLDTGAQYAWFLTANSTLPTEHNWNPLNDTNVVLAVYAYVNNNHNVNYIVYIQRQAGQKLFQDSVRPNCSTAATIYMCGNYEMPTNTNSNVADFVANFTGAATNQTGTNNARGQSYFCGGSINFGTEICYVGGYKSTAIYYEAQVQNETLLPWLNVQNSYHFGIYMREGNFGSIALVTKTGAISPIISVYTPPASSVSPTQDTGGYFGWLKTAFIGSTCAAFKVVTLFLADPCTQLANAPSDMATAFSNGIATALVLLTLAFRTLFNAIGNLLGLGNIGDLLVTIFSTIGTLIISGFNAIIGFFTAIGSLITSGYFTFLAGAAVLIGALIPAALILWNIIFNGVFTVTDILFFDYCLGMAMVLKAMNNRRSCLKAFLGWIALNVFIFTFIFNAAWTIFDIVTRPILRTKQTIDPLG